MTSLRPFHLAIPVAELNNTRTFYRDVIGCVEGRSSDEWVDFDFYGHQLVIHLDGNRKKPVVHNEVDGQHVPIPHFGVVLTMDDWVDLSKRLRSKNINFVVEPQIRFEGEVGEQATMFFHDPSGNALEFKAFKDINQLFAK